MMNPNARVTALNTPNESSTPITAFRFLRKTPVSWLALVFLLSGPAFGQEVSVEVIQPERRDIERTFALPGTLKPYEEATLYAKVSGYLGEIGVDIGDRVEAGQALARLEIPEMAPQIAQTEAQYRKAVALLTKARAEADAAVAQAEAFNQKGKAALASVRKAEVEAALKEVVYKRYQGLKEDNAITDLEFEEAQGEFETAKASLVSAQANVASAVADTKSAQAQVAVARSEIAVAEASVSSASAETKRLEALASYATIRAPYKGVVTARYVDTGQLINEGTSGKSTPIVRLARDEKLRLQFDVPEKDVPYVKPGTPFTFLPDSLPHHPVSGEVTRIAQALEQDSRTMLAEAEIENGDCILKPGMFVRTTVELELRKDALTLPATALVVQGGQVSVWVVENGSAERAPVEIGYDDGDIVEITKGLTEEARVVVAGQVSLTDGATVRVAVAP